MRFASSVRKVCGPALSEAFGLIGLICIERRSIREEENDHQEKEEVTGRVPEEGLEPVQPRHGESLAKHCVTNLVSLLGDYSILHSILSVIGGFLVIADDRPVSRLKAF